MRKHIYRTRVRYNEVDKMNVVHNSVYYLYMELARTDLVRAEGVPYKRMETEGVLIPVVKSGCSFVQPARYDDVLFVETHIKYIRNASLRFEYAVKREDDVLLAQGYTVHAIVDNEFEVIPFPERWRSVFEKYVASE